MKEETKNFLFSVIVAFAIFWVFGLFFGSKEEKSKLHNVEKIILKREDAIKLSERIDMENEEIQGTINTQTGAIDDLRLKKYKETIEPDSPDIYLLHPQDTKNMCSINPVVKNFDTTEPDVKPWVVQTTEKRSEVKLEKTEHNLKLERTYILDDDYCILVTDTVTNIAKTPQKVRFSQVIKQTDKPTILNEGVVGFLGSKLKNYSHYDLDKKGPVQLETKGGWVGVQDKYWFVGSLLPDRTEAEISVSKKEDYYELAMFFPTVVMQPKQQVSQTYHVFTGAKHMDVLEKIRDTKNIERFDLVVDFGWLAFLTMPIFKFLNWIVFWVGNFGVAIIILTTISKIVLLPLSIKSYKAMLKMKNVGPKIERIKELYSDDKIRVNQEILALYQREKVKPMGGCLPLLLQIPIFFCLYKVLSINIEMRHAPLIWWIKDLSAPDPTSFANLFGLLPYTPHALFAIGLLPIIMGITMFIQQKITPQSYGDPAQEKAMLFMPFFFTYIFASFPAGLVIYWTWSNIITIIQQMWMNRYIR